MQYCGGGGVLVVEVELWQMMLWNSIPQTPGHGTFIPTTFTTDALYIQNGYIAEA